MGKPLIECVPNFSEGRRPEVIEAIVAPFKNRPGVYLFDYRADEDHNRLVVSLVGHPAEIQESLLEAAKVARDHIDMNTHQGAHPRIGAVDVVPFTPIANITMEECVELARSFGKRYVEETGIPVYYYEDAALIPERKRLEEQLASSKARIRRLEAERQVDRAYIVEVAPWVVRAAAVVAAHDPSAPEAPSPPGWVERSGTVPAGHA